MVAGLVGDGLIATARCCGGDYCALRLGVHMREERGPGVGRGTWWRRRGGGGAVGRASDGAGSQPGDASSVGQGMGGPAGEEAGEWGSDMWAPQHSTGWLRFDLIQFRI
jgi:hypothetical protein